ncbi:hypothetical protein IQ06DRAFT_8775 [Phaeosphaeriaceae sp. SRC1lsM3a]|nr:hypothetical protein IQ06DRAFT_8775 [Stagonospora sp. SRC1lsM3a]
MYEIFVRNTLSYLYAPDNRICSDDSSTGRCGVALGGLAKRCGDASPPPPVVLALDTTRGSHRAVHRRRLFGVSLGVGEQGNREEVMRHLRERQDRAYSRPRQIRGLGANPVPKLRLVHPTWGRVPHRTVCGRSRCFAGLWKRRSCSCARGLEAVETYANLPHQARSVP